MAPRKYRLGCMWLTMLGIAGCADQSTCDRDQELRYGLCRDVAVSSGGAGAAGAGGTGGGSTQGSGGGQSDAGAAGAPACDPLTTFDDPCAGDAGCGCDAPSCAILPGNATGFCTSTCESDPTVCPAEWECVDLGRFGSYPKTCLPAGLLGP